jgi:hypothetical protein
VMSVAIAGTSLRVRRGHCPHCGQFIAYRKLLTEHALRQHALVCKGGPPLVIPAEPKAAEAATYSRRIDTDFQRRRDHYEPQPAPAAPRLQLDPARALPGHCQICGEYVGDRGHMWLHHTAKHASYPMQPGAQAPQPQAPLGPPGGRTPPGHCPKCGEKVEPRMLRRHTKLCPQSDFYGRPR